MSQKSEIERIIALYAECMNNNDVSRLPLSDDVKMSGPMTPNAVTGEEDVRLHIAEIAPFVARMTPQDLLIDGDRAALFLEFEGLNGVRVKGCQYFRFRDGRICENRAYFDSAILMKGAS